MLEKLCNIIGVSGYENKVIDFLNKEAEKIDLDEVRVDKVGNLVCYKKGNNSKKTILVTAHVDEVGYQIIKHIDKGKYRFKCLGNIKTWNSVQQRVQFSSKKIGTIYAFDETNLKAYNYENLFVDICNEYNNIEVGETFTYLSEFYENDHYYIGKALDNRISCYCLMELLKKNFQNENDIFFVFTVQEEIGMRGSRVAKSTIKPDIYINLDVSGECEMNSVQINEGVGIKLSDSMAVSSIELVNFAKKVAHNNNIAYQLEVSDCGTSELIITNELDYGCSELGVSIPCLHIHTANSVVAKCDVNSCINLLYKLLLKL